MIEGERKIHWFIFPKICGTENGRGSQKTENQRDGSMKGTAPDLAGLGDEEDMSQVVQAASKAGKGNESSLP